MIQEDFDQAFDRIIANAVNPAIRAQLSDDVDLMAVGVESLQLIQIIMRLEDELGIFWPVEQLAEHEKFTKIGVLRKGCRSLLETAPPADGSGNYGND